MGHCADWEPGRSSVPLRCSSGAAHKAQEHSGYFFTVFPPPSSLRLLITSAALSPATDIFAALCIRETTWHGNRMQCHCSEEAQRLLVPMHVNSNAFQEDITDVE